MNDLNFYLNLIPSANAQQPTFIATLSIWLNYYVYLQAVIASMVGLFDVDLAVGDQLDIIGKWVGISREVSVPITGVYFSWDDTDADGWNFGVWKGPFDPSSEVTTLPDDIYRLMIKGKIAANNWDGTVPGIYDVWAIAFPTIPVVVQDNQNMTMVIGLPGAPLNSLTKALISQGYIPLKPEGVGISYAFATVDAPLFGWGMENSLVSGWGVGTWAEIL